MPFQTEEERRLEFWKYHEANPQVYVLFTHYARQMWNKQARRGVKRPRYSAKAIIERVRWHHHITTMTDDEFKINDHLTAYYARLFVRDFPICEGFFQQRKGLVL